MMNDIKRIGLRMPYGTYLKLEDISNRYGIPVASLINFIVAQWVDSQLYIRDKLIETFKSELVQSGFIQEVKEGKFDERI